MPYETILYAKDGGIAFLTLNRPEKLNAINRKMREELIEVLQGASQDDQTRVVRGEWR